MKRATLIASLLLATFAAVPSGAEAYVLSGERWASLPATWHVNTANVPSTVGASAMIAATQAAERTWAAPSCTNYSASYAGTSTTTQNTDDSFNVYLFLTSWPAELGSTALGVTTPVWDTGSNAFVDADIVYNGQNFQWNTDGSGGYADFQSITTHEQGHFLGMNHSTVSGAVMYPSYSSGQVRNLSSDDTMGVCAIYPSSGGTTSTDPCANLNSCNGCTGNNGCGWCSGSSTCMAGDSSGPTSGSCSRGWAADLTACTTTAPNPDDPCSQFSSTGCGGCTNYDGCGFCSTNNQCMSGSQMGGSNDGSCGGSSWSWFTSDCTSGTTTPAGTAAFGEPCSQATDCSSGGPCIRDMSGATNGGICSRFCSGDCSCTHGYSCYPLSDGSGNVCAPGMNTCATGGDAGVTDAGAPHSDSGVIFTTDAGAHDAGTTGDDGSVGGDDGGTGTTPHTTGGSRRGGCSVQAPSSDRSGIPFALFFIAGSVIVSRRRRSR